MPHTPKVPVPKFLVVTTDGDSATTLHASSNEPGSARVAHDANPGSIVLRDGKHAKEFDKPPKK